MSGPPCLGDMIMCPIEFIACVLVAPCKIVGPTYPFSYRKSVGCIPLLDVGNQFPHIEDIPRPREGPWLLKANMNRIIEMVTFLPVDKGD